jgi:hypothetical protein
MNVAPTELNKTLAASLYHRMEADQAVITGRVYFWRLLGLGFIGLGIGVTVGIGCAGYSYVTRNSTNFDALAVAISKGLSEVTLKSVAQGIVNIDRPELSLAKDQTVSLDKNSRLRLDPKTTVRAEGELVVQAPLLMPPPASSPRVPRTTSRTVVNFSVFKTVPFQEGSVVTGWKFLTSTQRSPSTQYCYFTTSSGAGGADVNLDIDLGIDGQPVKSAAKIDFESAFTRCVWFRG